MNELEDWAVGLCTTAIGMTVVLLLLPTGRLKKTISVLIGVCYFSCLIAPIYEWCQTGMMWTEGRFLETTTVSENVRKVTDEQVDRVIEQTLIADAQTRLSDYAVEVTKARIERDVSGQDGIYIHGVELTLVGERLPRDQYVSLELAWGVEVEVIYEDE